MYCHNALKHTSMLQMENFSVQWRCWASYYDEALPFYSDINLWNVSRWKIFSKILNNNYMDLQFCMKMNCLIGVIRKNMIYWKALMVKLEHYLYIYVQESPMAYDERRHVKFGWNSFLITIFGNSICLLRPLFVSAYSLKLSVCTSVCSLYIIYPKYILFCSPKNPIWHIIHTNKAYRQNGVQWPWTSFVSPRSRLYITSISS